MSATQRSYREITDRLVEILEQGTVPWHKPWNSGEPCQNLTTRRPYRGINPFVLNCRDTPARVFPEIDRFFLDNRETLQYGSQYDESAY